jgi:hypothetical protein
MIRLWDEVGVRVYDLAPPTTRTLVYRGCECVRRADGAWDVWWLAISGHEGHLGRVQDETAARRLVDATWAPLEEGFGE